jgi:hypothetical protein
MPRVFKMNITVSALVIYIVCGNMVLDQKVCLLFFFPDTVSGCLLVLRQFSL